jgi:trigger factor
LPWGFESPLSHPSRLFAPNPIHPARVAGHSLDELMAENTSGLTIAVQESTASSRRLSIVVAAERVERTRGRVAEQIARGARLPGFRKGKLPTRVIEQRFGPSIDQETIDRLIQETYREALETQGITPISQGRVDEVKYDKGADLTFEVEVEVQPEIELARLGGFTASRPPVEVGEGDVDSVLDRLRDERAEWAPIEEGSRPSYGDQVLVEIIAHGETPEADEEPRSYRIVIGEGQAIPDVEAAILTLSTGETGEFSVAFPEDFPDEERRGQSQKLRIELKEASRKVLPELDDEFAKGVGEFESVAALRERVLKDLTEDAEQRAEADVRRQLIDQVLEANPFEAPRSMLDRYLDYMLEGPRQERKPKERAPEEQERYEQLRETLRPQAEWGLKRSMVVERIAEREGLRASQDEIDQRVEALAEQHNRSAGEVWIQLEKSGQLDELEREITEEKVFEYLKSQNTVA